MKESKKGALRTEGMGFLLWQATSMWQRELRRELEQHDLTHSQYVLLSGIETLSSGKEPVTQVLISNYTRIDPMTTSTVLRTLQKKGLVSRKDSSKDTRAKTIVLTTKGKSSIAKALKTVEEFDEEFFKPIGNKPKKFHKGLVALLKD